MDIFGIGAVIEGISQGMAGVGSYQAQKHERDKAWRRKKWWALNAPSLHMAGLRQAGLNPILAAGGGMSGAPGTNVPQGGAPSPPSFSGIAQRGVATAKAARAMKDELAKIRAEANAVAEDYGKPPKTRADYLLHAQIEDITNRAFKEKALEERAKAEKGYFDEFTKLTKTREELAQMSKAEAKSVEKLYRELEGAKGVERLVPILLNTLRSIR